MSEGDAQSRRYALRVLPRAERDIEAQTVRMAELAGPDIARAWYQGLFGAVATLSENPHRCALVSESRRFQKEVRHFLYRRTPTGPLWRILFTVDESAQDDAPTVNLLHVRHGAQRPITRPEARQIEAEQ